MGNISETLLSLREQKINFMNIQKTLLFIENYGAKKGGNIFELYSAAREDAKRILTAGAEKCYFGTAFYFIEEREAGRPLTDAEKRAVNYSFDSAWKDLTRLIMDSVYSILPEGLAKCRILKNYYSGLESSI